MIFLPDIRRRHLFTGILAILAAGIIYQSLWKVPTGHRGVLFILGRIRPEPLLPGLHLSLPAPITDVRLVPADLVQQVRVQADQSSVFASQSDEYLTGDENLLKAEIRVDYRISDLLEAARAGSDRTASNMKLLARAQLTEILAITPVRQAIGLEREQVARLMAEKLQAEADRQGLGIAIINTAWINLTPPEEVKADFEMAQSAATEAAQSLAKAQSEVIAAAQRSLGLASEMRNQAATQATVIVAQARLEAERFTSLRKESQRTGQMLTAKELWLSTVSQILPALKSRIIMATEQPVDLSIVRSATPLTNPESKRSGK